MFLLGYDIGSSSVKASLVNAETGKCVSSAFFPKTEANIIAVNPGWAEQDPESWWENLKLATQAIMTESGVSAAEIKAIGISYQMHGLVCVDKSQRVLRPAIIWCDSRAVPYGQKAFETIGEERCLSHLLNSPGNFTASKLAWIKENEPAIYEQIYKIMLPGDYIAMKLSGEICTTVSGLSEGMFWDFKNNRVADFLMDYYGFDSSLIADIKPSFAEQGRVSAMTAKELGLKEGTPITYRAGDQPNNALSLNVFNPGEIASTAGTSGVVYGVNGEVNYDPQSRVNTFAHVNHTIDQTRLGVLLCINGTGILNSWVKRNIAPEGISYNEMNVLASKAPIGSAGISILPFGNGAERMLNNKEIGCSIRGLDFNAHGKHHIIRAAQEGIVFSFKYGIDIMEQMGIPVKMIHAGHANMFLSSIFRDTLAGVTGATIELYDTDGSVGAAKGAGIGAGIYKDNNEAFATLDKLDVIEPNVAKRQEYADAYAKWEALCEKRFNQLKANEEELNRIFIDIYGLQDELTPEVEDKDVTVRKADLQRDIKSLISYAVGCMFGRYSLDVEGLAYAGGEWDASKYASFAADKDNIIPICDDEYFDDDIAGRFVKFIEVVYGKDTLDENLKFIADALGGKGQPREVIRNYFLNDFYADHCKIYQKRPIYWLFDSGKKNGFKALIYMHRYQPDTIARIRTDYVHEQQSRYRTAIADLENRIANASTSERVKLNKALTKLKDQDAELRSYEEKIHHLADQMIAIDLDDGVKVNYAKFQDVLGKIK